MSFNFPNKLVFILILGQEIWPVETGGGPELGRLGGVLGAEGPEGRSQVLLRQGDRHTLHTLGRIPEGSNRQNKEFKDK